jgi:putative membrane protein
MGFLGGIFMLVFWGLIIAGLVLLVRWLWDRAQPGTGAGDAPLEILKRRYARGEIGKEEFERIKKDLE